MPNKECLDIIHDLRNLACDISLNTYNQYTITSQKVIAEFKHRLEELWTTCLNCSKCEIVDEQIDVIDTNE